MPAIASGIPELAAACAWAAATAAASAARLAALAWSGVAAAAPVFLRPAAVFDGAAMHVGWQVLVDGDKIVAAEPALALPAGASAIDLPYATLLPGLIEAGTFLAILGGQLLAGVLAPWEAGLAATGLACVGFAASLAIPPAPPSGTQHRIDWNVFRGTADILRTARRDRLVVLSILGISWFFAAGAVLVSEFAPLVSGTLGGSKAVVTLFLLVFSTAIAIGSLTVNRLLRGEVSARYVPLSAAVMGGCMIDLWASTHGFQVRTAGLDIAHFFAAAGSWHILIGLAGISFAGGMFIVPLYAILSTATPAAERSRVIAANNIANSIVTVLVVIVATAMIALGSDVPGVIGMLGVATLGVALVLRGMPRRGIL